MTEPRATLDDLRVRVEAIADPEIPVLTLGDLGVIREVAWGQNEGTVAVSLTPTYTACPATEFIRRSVEQVVTRHGWTPQVTVVLSPPWHTDLITAEGREKLRLFGIAPPTGDRPSGPVSVSIGTRPLVACPRCDSTHTEEIAHFGSTPCKAHWRCQACGEPFDYFKPH